MNEPVAKIHDDDLREVWARLNCSPATFDDAARELCADIYRKAEHRARFGPRGWGRGSLRQSVSLECMRLSGMNV